jgi:hypothetical protein
MNQVGKRVGEVIKAIDKRLQETPKTDRIHYL